MTSEFGNNGGEDVVEQILSILPPKALMRFKCVSKKWYALITNPRFVAMHLSNSMHNNLSTTRVLLKRLVHNDTNTNETNEANTNTSNVTNDEAEEVFSFLHFRKDHDDNDVDDEHDHSFLFSIHDMNIPLSTGRKTDPKSFSIIGHCNGIICLAHSISGEVVLCNPAIQEFKLLPSSPYLPDSDWQHAPLFRFIDALGFGYDPNLKEYKVVNIGFTAAQYSTPDGFHIYLPPKAAVHTLGADSWREIKTDSLETETSILWPEDFQMHFNEMCYWVGREQHKELDVFDASEEEFIRNVIIMFDTGDELFHGMTLPDSLYDRNEYFFGMRLLVWNQSISLFGAKTLGGGYVASIGIWVMDEFGAWTKHITFDPTEEPLAFWKSDEIVMNDRNGRILSYNLGTKKLNYLPIQSKWTKSAVVYVNSIVSVLGGNKLKSRDNSTPNV
jgi:F-box interacting protein